ncbi:hypothetical protein EYF80_027031 [Liparis tanakae]|uniref:Secreted protein n=1 Tax=Liparis tanakae TaxID=230148 RepID=A0A4Z2HC05_9TELE|nr:hypothetical protein EYF80_027031 [Liparis tanakae]
MDQNNNNNNNNNCFSRAFLLAFLPWVLASRALASDSISSSHWAAVRPMMGAMVRHWVGISLARWSSFSSSSLDHSVFLMLGSNHSYLHKKQS